MSLKLPDEDEDELSTPSMTTTDECNTPCTPPRSTPPSRRDRARSDLVPATSTTLRLRTSQEHPQDVPVEPHTRNRPPPLPSRHGTRECSCACSKTSTQSNDVNYDFLKFHLVLLFFVGVACLVILTLSDYLKSCHEELVALLAMHGRRKGISLLWG